MIRCTYERKYLIDGLDYLWGWWYKEYCQTYKIVCINRNTIIRRLNVYLFWIDKPNMCFFLFCITSTYVRTYNNWVENWKLNIADDKILAASQRNSKNIFLKQTSKKHNVPKSTYIFLLIYILPQMRMYKFYINARNEF